MEKNVPFITEKDYQNLRHVIDDAASFYGHDGYDGLACADLQDKEQELEKVVKLAYFLKKQLEDRGMRK